MKKNLLASLIGLGCGLPMAQAQQAVPTLTAPEGAYVSPIEALVHPTTSASRTAVAVRQHTRFTTYPWNAATNQWSAAPTVTNLTYNVQGLVSQEIVTDSATSVPTTRTTTRYTATNRLANQVQETWTGSQWQNATQSLYTYNSGGLLTETQLQHWVDGTWLNRNRTQHTYDTGGRRTRTLSQRWTNNAWVTAVGFQTTYTLDAQNRVAEEVLEVWDRTASAFTFDTRYLYTYVGTSTNYSSYLIQHRSGTMWYVARRVVEVVYNAKDQPISFDTQTWDGIQWLPSERTTIEYLPTRTIETRQRFVSGNWENSFRSTQDTEVNGNGNGNAYSYFSEGWTGSAWRLDAGSLYFDTFNATNDRVRRLHQNVDGQSHTLVNQYKYYFYDFQSFVLASRAPAALAAQAQLYPNPATDQATLELTGLRGQQPAQVELINSLGQVVRTFTAQPQAGAIREQLNVGGLPAGVYSVRLRTADGTAIKRLVKE